MSDTSGKAGAHFRSSEALSSEETKHAGRALFSEVGSPTPGDACNGGMTSSSVLAWPDGNFCARKDDKAFEGAPTPWAQIRAAERFRVARPLIGDGVSVDAQPGFAFTSDDDDSVLIHQADSMDAVGQQDTPVSSRHLERVLSFETFTVPHRLRKRALPIAAAGMLAAEERSHSTESSTDQPQGLHKGGRRRFQSECYAADGFALHRRRRSAGPHSADSKAQCDALPSAFSGAHTPFVEPNVSYQRDPVPVAGRLEVKPERLTRLALLHRQICDRSLPFPFTNRRGRVRFPNETLPPRVIREQLHGLRRLFRRITHVIRHTTFLWHEEDDDSLLGDNMSDPGDRKDSYCGHGRKAPCPDASDKRAEAPSSERQCSVSKESCPGGRRRSCSAGELELFLKASKDQATQHGETVRAGAARLVATETEETFEDDGVITEDVPDQKTMTTAGPTVWAHSEVLSDEKDPTQRTRDMPYLTQKSCSFGAERSRRRHGEVDLCCLLRRLITVLQHGGPVAPKDVALRPKERKIRSWLVSTESTSSLPSPSLYGHQYSGENAWQRQTERDHREGSTTFSCPVSALDLLPLSFIRTLRLLLVHPEAQCRVLAIEACTHLLASAVQHRRFASLQIPNIISKALLREPEVLLHPCFEHRHKSGMCPSQTGRLATDRRWPSEPHAPLSYSGIASYGAAEWNEPLAATVSATCSSALFSEREAALMFIRVWTAFCRAAPRATDTRGRKLAASRREPCGASYCRCVDLDLFTRPLLPDVFVYTVTAEAADTEDGGTANMAGAAQPNPAHFRAASTGGKTSSRNMPHAHVAPNRATTARQAEQAVRGIEGKAHATLGAGGGQRPDDSGGIHQGGRNRSLLTREIPSGLQWRVACLETILEFGFLCPCILVETRTAGVLVDALTDVEAQAYNPRLGPSICIFLIGLLSHRYPERLPEEPSVSPPNDSMSTLACHTISPVVGGRGTRWSSLSEQFSSCRYTRSVHGKGWLKQDADTAVKTVPEDRCVCGRPLSSSSRIQLEQTCITELSRLCGVAVEIVQACASAETIAAAAGTGKDGAGRGRVRGGPVHHQAAPLPVFQFRRAPAGDADAPTRGPGATATGKSPAAGFPGARGPPKNQLLAGVNVPSGVISALWLYRRWILVSSALLCLSQSFSALVALWRLPTGLPSLVRLLASPIDPCTMCWILRLFHAMLSYAVGFEGRRMTLAECDSLSNRQIDKPAREHPSARASGCRREGASSHDDRYWSSSLVREPAGMDVIMRRRFHSGKEDERPFSCPWASDNGHRPPFSGTSSPRRRPSVSGLYSSPFGSRDLTRGTSALSVGSPFGSGSPASLSQDYGRPNWSEASDPARSAYADMAFSFASSSGEAPADRSGGGRNQSPGKAPYHFISSTNQPVTRDIVHTHSLLVARLMLHAQLHVVLAGLCSLRDDHHSRTADTPCLIPVIPSDVQFVPETLKIDVHGVTEMSSSFAQCLLCLERGPAPRGIAGTCSNRADLLSATQRQRCLKDSVLDTRLPGSTLHDLIPFAAIVRTEAAHLLYALVHTVAAYFPLHLLRHKLDAETVFRELRPPPAGAPSRSAWVDRDPSTRTSKQSRQAGQSLDAQSQEFYRCPVDADSAWPQSRWQQMGQMRGYQGPRDRLSQNRCGGQGGNELHRATNSADELRLRKPFGENYQANTRSETAPRSVHNVAGLDHVSLVTLSESTTRAEQASSSVWHGPRNYPRLLASCFKRGSDSTSLSVISTLSLLHFVAAPPVRCGLRSLLAGGKLVCKGEDDGICGSLRLLLRCGDPRRAPQDQTYDGLLSQYDREPTRRDLVTSWTFDSEDEAGEADVGEASFFVAPNPEGDLQDSLAGLRYSARLSALTENGAGAPGTAEAGCGASTYSGPAFVQRPYPQQNSEGGTRQVCGKYSVTTRMTRCQQKRIRPSPSSETGILYDRRGVAVHGISTSSRIQEEILRRLVVMHEEEEGQTKHVGSCPTLKMLSDVVPYIFGDSARIGLFHRLEVCWHAAPCVPMVLPRRSLLGGPASLCPPFDLSTVSFTSASMPKRVDVFGRNAGSGGPCSAVPSVSQSVTPSFPSGVERLAVNQGSCQMGSVKNIHPGPGNEIQSSAGEGASCVANVRGRLQDPQTCTPSVSWMSALIELMNATGVLQHPVQNAALWDWQLISRLLLGPLVSHLRFLVAFSSDLTRIFEIFLQQILTFFLPSSCGFSCLPWDMDNLHFLLIANALVSVLLIVPHNVLSLSLPPPESLWTLQARRHNRPFFQKTQSAHGAEANQRCRSVLPRNACAAGDKGLNVVGQQVEKETTHAGQHRSGRRMSFSVGSVKRGDSTTKPPVGLRSESQCDSKGLPGDVSTKFNQESSAGAGKRGSPDEETGAGLCGRRALLMEIAGLLLQELLLPPHVSPASVCRCASSVCPSLSTPPVTQVPQDRPNMTRSSPGCRSPPDTFPQTAVEGQEQIRTPPIARLSSPTPAAPGRNPARQRVAGENLRSSERYTHPQAQQTGAVARPADPTERLPPRVQGGSPEVLRRKVSSIMRSEKPTGAHSGPATDSHMNTKPHVRLVLPTTSALKAHERHRAAAVTREVPGESRVASCPVQSEPNPAYEPHGGGAACPLEGEEVQIAARHSTAVSQSEQICASDGGRLPILQQTCGIETRSQSVEGNHRHSPDSHRGAQNLRGEVGGSTMRCPPTLPPQNAPFGQTLSLAAAAETAIVRLRGKRVVYHVRMRTSEQLPAELGRPRRCCLSPSTGAQVWGSHSRASGSRGQDTLGGLAGSSAYGSCQVSRANHGFSGTEAAPSASLRNEQLRLAAVLPRVLADHHTLRTLSAQYGAIVGTFSASLEGVIQLSKAGIFTLLIQLIDQGAEKDTLVGHFFPHLCLDFVPARRVASRILSRGSLFLRLRCLAYWQRQILDDDTPTDVAVSVTGHQAELGGSLESRPIATEIFRDKSLNAGTERHRDGTKDWCCPGRTTARSESEVSQSWHSVCESDDASAPSSGGSNVGLFAKTPRWAWQLQEVILKCLGPNQPALLRSEAIRIVTIVCRRKTRRAVRIILNLMETGMVSTESWPRVLQLQLLRADEGVRRGERDGWLYNLLNEYLAVAHGDGVETPQKWEGASPGQMQTEREENSKDGLQHWPTHRQDSRARLYTQDAMRKEERDADSEAGIDPTGCEKIEFRSSKYSPVALRDQTPLKRFVYVRLVEHLMAKVFKLPEIWETRVLGSKVVDLDLYSPGASSAGAHRPPYSVGLGPRGGAVATAFGGYPDAWSRRRTSLRMKPAPPQFPLFQAEVDPGVVEKLVHVPGSIFPSSTSTTTGKEATRPPVSWIFHLLQREEAAGSSVKPARGLTLYQEASEASASCSSSHTQSVVEAAFAQLDANIVVPGLAAAITFRRGKMSKGGAGRGFTWMSFVPAQLQVQLVAILESRSMAAQLSRTGGSVANGEKNSGESLRQECRDNEDLGRRRGEDSEDEDAAVRVAAIIREKGVRIALEEGLVSEEAINARMWIVEQFSLDAMVFADSVSAAQRNAMRYVCTSSSSARSSVSSALSSRSSRSGSSSLTPWREQDAKFFSVKDDRTNPSVGLPFAETSADEMSDRWSRTGVDDPATVVAESPPLFARLEQRRGRASALDGLVDLSDLDESYSLVSLGNHEHRVPVRKLLVPRRLLSDVANRTGDKRFLMEGRASRRRSSNTKEDDDSVNGEVLSPFLDVALRVRVNAGGTYADRTGRFQRDAEKAAWEYLSRTEQMVSIWEQMKSSGTHAAAGRGSQAPLSGESSVQQSGLRKVDEETIPASSSEPEAGHTPRDVTSQRGKDNEACGPRAMWNSIGPRCLTFNMESFLPPEDEARRGLDSHPERAASPPQEPSTLGPVVLCSGNFRWVFCMHRQPGQGRRDFADFNTFLRRWEQEQYMVHLVRLNGHIVVPRARRVAAAPPPSIISYLALTPSGCRVLLNHPTFLPYLESVLRRPNRVKSSEVCAAIWSVCQMASTSLGNEYLLEYERQKERRRRRAKAYAASKKGSDGEGSMKGGAQAGPCPHHGSGKERSVERIDSADSCGFETRNAGLAAPRPHRKMSLEYGSAVSPAKSTRVLETSERNGGEQSVSGSLSDPGGENEVLMSVNGEAKRGDSRSLKSGNFSSTCHRISRLLRNRDEAECNVSTSALLRLVMRIARRNSPPCVRSTCLHALSLVQVCEPAENAAAATHWDLAARGPVQERLFEYLAGIATGSEADTTDTEDECRDSDRAGRPPEEEKQRPSNLGFRPSVNRGVEGGAACSSRKEGNAADVHDSWISLGQLVWAPPFNPPVPPDGRDFSSLFSMEKAKGGNPGSNHPMSGRTPRNSMSAARTPRKRSKQDSFQRLEEGQQREVCLRDFTAEASSRSVSSSFHEDSMQDGFPSTSTSFDVPYTDGLPRETRARNENMASSLPDDSCRPSYACFGSQHWTILDMISKLPNSVAVRISGLTSQLQSVKHRNPSLFLSVELWWRVEQLMCLYCFSAHLRRLVASLFSETLNDPAALSYLDALSEHLSRLQGNDYHDMDGSG